MVLENLDKWAKIKGIHVLGTGDLTHPLWLKEIKQKLEPAEPGLFKLKKEFKVDSFGRLDNEAEPRFMLTGEISCIYSKGGKVRRVHHLYLVPDIETAEKINAKLSFIGNLKSDGRPILGLDSKKFLEICLEISPDIMVIPAHCLLPDTAVHTKNNLLTKIQNIKEGECVFTHKNRWRKVTEVLRRPYKGKVFSIKPYYFREGLTVTPEHPFYVIKTKKNCHWSKGICKPVHETYLKCTKKHYKSYKHSWVTAENIEKGDVLVFPRFNNAYSNHSVISVAEALRHISLIPVQKGLLMRGNRTKAVPDIINVNEDFSRLIGYYMAEGYTNGRDAIGFMFSKKEENYVADVVSLMDFVFGIKNYKRREENGIELVFYSKIVQELFEKLFYSSEEVKDAHTKMLPSWFLGLSDELLAELFKGWWRGDKGYTVSKELMNQMKIVLLKLGIVPSIYVDSMKSHFSRGKHKYQNRIIRANGDCYVLNRLTFFDDKFSLLSEPEFKQFNYKTKIKHGWIDKDHVYLPVRDIEEKDYKGPVYNLEVEDDNSYVTEFATVHNCWTPWFSIFGSKSGFDSIEECFDDLSKYIYAVETGLSSDPAMNWRLSKLDNVTLVSNSDSHSLTRIGREANVFDAELDYYKIIESIKSKDPKKFLFTVEFFPEEGKYHYDGHRLCNISFEPEETKKHNFLCPKCKRPLTVGVLARVAELADRPSGLKPVSRVSYKNVIPLDQIISDSIGLSVTSNTGWPKRVLQEYEKLIRSFGNEFNVLLDASADNLKKSTLPEIAEGITKVRDGRVHIEPGYDGEYGKIRIFTADERENASKQGQLL